MLPMMQEMLGRTYVRYGLASAVALACDICLFLILLRLGVAPAYAAAIGYGAGIFIHWLMSSRLVFATRAAARGSERHRQKMLFIASALCGLAITMATVAIANSVGLMPIMGKSIAIAISFQATYSLRKRVVFG